MSAAFIAFGAAGFIFSVIVLLFGNGTSKKDKVRGRLDELGGDSSPRNTDDEMSQPFSVRVLKPLISKITSKLALLIPIHGRGSAGNEKQKKMLIQAGWTISSEEYTVVQIITMLGCGIVGLVLALVSSESTGNTILYVIAGIFAGYAVLRYFCTSAGTRRKKAMENQLPDMLDLLSVSVAAGLGFERAMLHIIETMDGPLIDEFAVTYREMTMGRSRKDALTLLGERCGIDDLSAVTGALVQAGQLGIPIKNVLQTQSAAIRRTRRSKVQEKAAKVSTKILLPMIGLIFPVLIIVLMGPSIITIMEQFS